MKFLLLKPVVLKPGREIRTHENDMDWLTEFLQKILLTIAKVDSDDLEDFKEALDDGRQQRRQPDEEKRPPMTDRTSSALQK
jgi:predicted DNA-binding antitoxin AbrB/MazE fold protein